MLTSQSCMFGKNKKAPDLVYDVCHSSRRRFSHQALVAHCVCNRCSTLPPMSNLSQGMHGRGDQRDKQLTNCNYCGQQCQNDFKAHKFAITGLVRIFCQLSTATTVAFSDSVIRKTRVESIKYREMSENTGEMPTVS